MVQLVVAKQPLTTSQAFQNAFKVNPQTKVHLTSTYIGSIAKVNCKSIYAASLLYVSALAVY